MIKVLKLTNGDDIIAEVEEKNNNLLIKNNDDDNFRETNGIDRDNRISFTGIILNPV